MTFLIGLLEIFVTLAACGTVAQAQPAKISRIAYLSGSSIISSNTEAFQQGLRDLGYIEGKNIVIEWRFADGNRDRQRALAAELVRLKVDVIVASGGGDTRAAKEVTSTIPIVMAQTDDPVGIGFVASLARPGGNITGLSTLSPELSGKRLEILKEVVPKLFRVAVLGSSTNPGNADTLRELEVAAQELKVKLQYLDILNPNDIETAFRAAGKERAGAVILLSNSILTSQRRQIIDHAVKSRLPVSYARPEFVESGGLMTYGPSFVDLCRRAATYVDKILKGTNPADLPVEQPMKFEFVVNLKAAKQIGLTIPPNVLTRADKVLK